MKLSNFQSMDPHLLVGLVNTALRNDFEDLEDLVATHDLDKESLEQKLSDMGYAYVASINQFRSAGTGSE